MSAAFGLGGDGIHGGADFLLIHLRSLVLMEKNASFRASFGSCKLETHQSLIRCE